MKPRSSRPFSPFLPGAVRFFRWSAAGAFTCLLLLSGTGCGSGAASGPGGPSASVAPTGAVSGADGGARASGSGLGSGRQDAAPSLDCSDPASVGCPCTAGTANACSVDGCAGVQSCNNVSDGELSGGSVWGACALNPVPDAGTVTLPAGTTNLTEVAVTAGRTCVEAPGYSVVNLSGSAVTLSAVPKDDCLVAGDEVMLINLQGAPSATANVGAYELLRVAEVSGTSVAFTTPKKSVYGSGADDANVGTSASQQKVMLVRVPNICALAVPAGATMTADPWNGLTGGVVAVRSHQLTVGGVVTATGLGYGGGQWSVDGPGCTNSVVTSAGESISGVGAVGTANNVGGSGGIGSGGAFFNSNTPLSASAGHATAGQPGLNDQDRAPGLPGAAYGLNDGTQLTMGSGSGGSLTCDNGVSSPHLLAATQNSAGGVVALFGGDLNVTSSGSIRADGATAGRDSAPSGGYVLLQASTIEMGAGQVTAVGATGVDSCGTNIAGAGYVAALYQTSFTGTSSPVAYSQQIP